MKTTLALWIVSVLLGAGGHQHSIRWMAPSSIVQERFQAGPLLLELRVQCAPGSEAEDSDWPGPEIGIKTDFAASLAPFAIRIALVLYMESDRAGTSRQDSATASQDEMSESRVFMCMRNAS